MNTNTRGRYAAPRKPRTRSTPFYLLAALAAGLLLVGACTGDTAEQVHPEPVAEESGESAHFETFGNQGRGGQDKHEPTTQPTTLSIEQAADRYLEIIGPVNAAATEAAALAAVGRYREGCEVMIEPDRKALDKFAAEQWPGDVDRLIKDQLIPLTEDEIAAYSSCAGASNDRQAEDISWSDVYDAQEARGAVSGAVRTLLNLPQVTQ